MNSKRFAKMTTAITVLVVSGLVLTYATIPDSNGVIHACYNKSGGSIRVIDDSVTKCSSNETSLNWNVTGPSGPTGPQGLQGPAGLQGPPGPSNAFVQKFDPGALGFPLSNVPVIVQAVNLPAGNYVVTASLDAFSDTAGVGFSATCFLVNGSANPVLSGALDTKVAVGSAGEIGNLVLLGWLQLSAPGAVTLQCYSGSNSSQVTHSSLGAIQVGSLNAQ